MKRTTKINRNDPNSLNNNDTSKGPSSIYEVTHSIYDIDTHDRNAIRRSYHIEMNGWSREDIRKP
jgi:hypothetical protein